MNKQYEHINRKRKKDFHIENGESNESNKFLLETLHQAIDTLAKDLYRKESHFILELIQNAEDNEYVVTNPTLSFSLIQEDPTGSDGATGALIIENNEEGFSEANMDAICSVGSSFKQKIKGYIGEKGIGFKSVFNITRTPHIFSNNYQVRFPDEIPKLGLGYIVPEWVDSIPKGIDLEKTTIILPINNPKYDFQKVGDMMSQFVPETILFLDKIRNLRFSVEGEYETSISKTIEDGVLARLNIVTSVGGQETESKKEYLIYTKNYLRPLDLLIDGREQVMDRDITIAFPVGKNIADGAVFVYLPVLDNTGLPFLINADFLVPGSRDMIYEDSKWNKWLLHKIPDLYVEAFSSFIKLKKYRIELFKHIPLTTKASFFEPIIEPILKSLNKLAIIPTAPNGKFVAPSLTLSSSEFRKVITGLNLPAIMKNRLIMSELQQILSKEVIKALGIQTLTRQEIVQCLHDSDWIKDIGYEGLIRLYQYLANREKQYEDQDLTSCPIVPIKHKKKVIFSCKNAQPIYFEATKKDIHALSEAPSCIKVPIRFLDGRFFAVVREDKEIVKWLTDVLEVFPFDLSNYAVDVLDWFNSNYMMLSDDEFIAVTDYILDHIHSNSSIEDIPILLNDGQRVLLSYIKMKNIELVTPIGLDLDAGWQNIFTKEKDRKHLYIIADAYLYENGKTPKIVTLTNANRYPSLPREIIYPYREGWPLWTDTEFYTEKEREYLRKGHRNSSDNRLWELTLLRIKKPSGLNGEISKKTAISLLKWLNGISRNKYYPSYDRELNSEVSWFYYTEKSEYFESEMTDFLLNSAWLPSTLGKFKPSQIFKKNPSVKDVLGDTVPYLVYEINSHLANYLGIRDDLSNNELLSILSEFSSSGKGNIRMAERIYSTLNSRNIDEDIRGKLIESNCIAVPKGDTVEWVSPKICVWHDRSNLFIKDFHFLSNVYPKLQSFFTDVLDVAIDIGDEQFCELWLDIQRREITNIKETEDKLGMLYYRLKPQFNSPDLKEEEWWQSFLSKAKLWSSRKKFLKNSQVYIPDDGILKDVFNKEQVDYLWYPKGCSYSQWESLHSAFNIRSLKKAVSITLINVEENSLVDPPLYLTHSAKTLILVWLWEKKRDRFSLLTDNGIIPAFTRTIEYRTKKLVMEYTLDDISVEDSRDCYIDLSIEKMHYTRSAGKTTIAAEISRILTENDYDEHLELWVKGALSAVEDDLRDELKKNNWQIPDELRQLMSGRSTSSDKFSVDESSNDDNAENQPEDDEQDKAECFTDETEEMNGEDNGGARGSADSSSQESTQHQHKKRGSYSGGSSGQSSGQGTKNKASSGEGNGFQDDSEAEDIEDGFKSEESFEDELFSGFNTKDKPINDQDEWNDSHGSSNDPNGRYEREYDRASDKNKNSRSQNDRYREVRRKILDGPDPLVRESLYRWYTGRCQICGSTFYQKNGKQFYISHYLVPRRVSDSTDMTGNSICLCADHFAQMVYGRIKSPDIIKQLESIDPANDSFELGLEINGEDLIIKYNQQHAIALKAFYESVKDSTESYG